MPANRIIETARTEGHPAGRLATLLVVAEIPELAGVEGQLDADGVGVVEEDLVGAVLRNRAPKGLDAAGLEALEDLREPRGGE